MTRRQAQDWSQKGLIIDLETYQIGDRVWLSRNLKSKAAGLSGIISHVDVNGEITVNWDKPFPPCLFTKAKAHYFLRKPGDPRPSAI